MVHSEVSDPVQLPSLPPELAAAAKDTSFGGDDLLAEAARRIMSKHTRKLYHHLPGVLTGDDPHDVHQARVATRRLRACMEATAPAFNPKQIQQLRQELRRLARALGEVRDRDVLLLRLRADADRHAEEDRGPINDVIARVQQERSAAHAALLKEIGRKRTKRLLERLNTFLLRPLDEVQAHTELPLLVRHYAGSSMLRRYEEVRQFETLMEHATSEQLHDLRIACKHLRYTLELFEPALPDTVQAVTGLVTEMQEHLGSLHDADVALAYFGVEPAAPTPDDEETVAAPAGSNGAAPPDEPAEDEPHDAWATYIGEIRTQRTQLIEGVTPLWNRMTNLTNRRKLAGAIATL